MRRVNFLAAFLLAATASSGQALQPAQADETEALPPSVLERQPTEWPASQPGAWRDWKAEDQPPPELAALVQQVVAASGAGDLPRALEVLFVLLEAAPDYPSALHQAGIIYFRLRRYGDAAVALERYLAVVPGRVVDTRALGHCYYTLGDYEKALAHYALVLAQRPESVEALRGKGLAEMRLGQTSAALTTLARVLKLDPRHANAQTWIAQILFDEERAPEALKAAQRGRDLDPFEPRAWFLLSQIHYDLGQNEEGDGARKRFDELSLIAQELRAAEARLLYDPRQPAVYAELVALNRRAGNGVRARHWMVRWIQTAPQDVDLRLQALDLALWMGDDPGAAACAEALWTLAGDSLAVWQRLARYHAGRRDRIKQVAAEEQVARLKAQR
ncbi:MAG TPA: tetratricopeptide repeat protein [Planctomycetes bacterium]|nr:tetratricopeptide repeat protein [Planctomycetota bacterium]